MTSNREQEQKEQKASQGRIGAYPSGLSNYNLDSFSLHWDDIVGSCPN